MALGGTSGGGSGGAGGVRAGRGYVELGVKDSMTAALKRLAGRFASFGKQVLALTGIGGLLGGALGGLGFKETADDLAKMNDVAKAFGITGRQASGLFGVLAAAGGEFKENLEGIVQFSSTMDKALNDIGQGAELFDGLNVTAKELANQPIDEQFYRVLGAIRQLPQGLQQSKLALLGGTDSLKQWQRLLSMSEAEVRQMAKDMAISSQEMEEAAQASRAIQQAGAAANRVWQQVVITLSPLVKGGADWITGGLKQVAEWLKGRTLQHLWDEAVAYFNLGWQDIRQRGLEAWLDVSGAVEDFWYDAEAAGKIAFIKFDNEVTKFKARAERFLSKDIWDQMTIGFTVALNTIDRAFKITMAKWERDLANKAKFALLVATNPVAAAAIISARSAVAAADNGITPDQLKGIAKAAEKPFAEAIRTGAEVLRGGEAEALAEAERKKAEAAARREAQRQAGRGELFGAVMRLVATQARIEKERAARQKDEEVAARDARVDAKVRQMGRTLGTFGAGQFLGQSYAVRSADKDVGDLLKEGNRESKKQTELLKKITGLGLVATP